MLLPIIHTIVRLILLLIKKYIRGRPSMPTLLINALNLP
jgi:hypothetical protein